MYVLLLASLLSVDPPALRYSVFAPSGDSLSALTSGPGNDIYVVGTDQQDATVARLTERGEVLWRKTIGGSRYESATAVASDSAGNVYVGGNTYSSDFPTLHPLVNRRGELCLDGQFSRVSCEVFANGGPPLRDLLLSNRTYLN